MMWYDHISLSMSQCHTLLTPPPTHWCYHRFVLSNMFIFIECFHTSCHCYHILLNKLSIDNNNYTRHYTSCGHTVYPKKYAHGFCFAVLCCGYTLADFPISIRLTSLALRQSNNCPSASKATLMNLDKYFMWIHYERLHNHNKAKHNKTVCIFLGIYCMLPLSYTSTFSSVFRCLSLI